MRTRILAEWLIHLHILWLCINCSAPSNHTFFSQSNRANIIVPVVHLLEEEVQIIQVSHFTLYLDSHKLLASFISTYFNPSGEVRHQNNITGCICGGSVRGFPKWLVAIDICNGLRGHFGNPFDQENYYHIEPLIESGETRTISSRKIEQPHIFYSESIYSHNRSLDHGVCVSPLWNPIHIWLGSVVGEESAGGGGETEEEGESSETENNGELRRPKIVELVLVSDYYQYLRYSMRLLTVVLRNIEIVDYMNELYRDFNISIALVGAVTWTNGDLIPTPYDNNPEDLLKNFKDYYTRIPGPFDAALLISGRDFKGSIVGLAFKSSMCYELFSVGIVQDGRGGVNYVGGTAAHELGHILGVSHDEFEGRTCSCNDPTGKCLMAAISTSTPAVQWSNCSLHDIRQSFSMYPFTESCLYNKPDRNVTIHQGSRSNCMRVESFKATAIIAGLTILFFYSYCIIITRSV